MTETRTITMLAKDWRRLDEIVSSAADRSELDAVHARHGGDLNPLPLEAEAQQDRAILDAIKAGRPA